MTAGTAAPGRAGRWAVAAVSWALGGGAAVAVALAPWRRPHLIAFALCALFVAGNGWYLPRRARPTLSGQGLTLAGFFGGLALLAWLVPLLR